MKKNWVDEKIKRLSSIGGYVKPELISDSIKLDSNENYVISKQLQNDIINTAKKNSDVREYPLGGVEQLIESLAKFLKVPSNMIGVGNGSDQILDLILSNFASKSTKVLTSNPTFGFFEERCKLYSIPMIRIPFSDDMKLDLNQFLKASKITSPGLILTGNDSPSSASDYILGSNHILPTNGFGKVRGSLSVLDFMKLNTKVRTSKDDLKKISKSMEILTNSEGLSNHFEAVRGRLK